MQEKKMWNLGGCAAVGRGVPPCRPQIAMPLTSVM